MKKIPGYAYRLASLDAGGHQGPVLVPQEHGLYGDVNVVIHNVHPDVLKPGQGHIGLLDHPDHPQPNLVEFDIVPDRILLAEEFVLDIVADNAYRYPVLFLIIVEKFHLQLR
jgi:hypothetical protein